MDAVLQLLFDIKDLTPVSAVLRILMSALLGGLIGYEREWSGKAAGLRTHMLVCLGACMTTLVGIYASLQMGFSCDPLRVGAQVISGIGFLGAGTILTRKNAQVTGLTTAAGLWATATIGLALGIGFHLAAIASAVVVTATMVLLNRADILLKARRQTASVYLELGGTRSIQTVVDEFSIIALRLEVVPPRSGQMQCVGIELTFDGTRSEVFEDAVHRLRAMQSVVYVLT